MKEPTITFSNDYGDYDSPEKHRLKAKMDSTIQTPQLYQTPKESIMNEAATKSMLEARNFQLDDPLD